MTKIQYIQPDARGRIQLPKEFRDFPLFEVESSENGLYLIPLETRRRQPKAWLHKETIGFCKKNLFPVLSEMLKNAPKELGFLALVLYGSRARGDALSSSDFDYAIICDQTPSLKKRHQWINMMEEKTQTQFSTLASHNVTGELSIQFIQIPSPQDVPPMLYLNIVEDGLLVWEKDSSYKDFCSSLESIKKKV